MAEDIRINKYLSEAGVCSRRAADRLVEEGRVTVDGHKAETGTRVLQGQSVAVDGKEVHVSEKKVLIAFNKPRGVVVTSFDPKSTDTNIIEYINYKERIFPIGRLDKDSSGLILLTNDGEITNEILKARNFHEKEYEVTVNKAVTSSFIKDMADGVPILDTVTRKCKVRKTGPRSFTIILTQGLNRQIRRMCEYFDYKVVELRRVRIMNIDLGSLPEGRYREIQGEELAILKKGLSGSRDGKVRSKEEENKRAHRGLR